MGAGARAYRPRASHGVNAMGDPVARGHTTDGIVEHRLHGRVRGPGLGWVCVTSSIPPRCALLRVFHLTLDWATFDPVAPGRAGVTVHRHTGRGEVGTGSPRPPRGRARRFPLSAPTPDPQGGSGLGAIDHGTKGDSVYGQSRDRLSVSPITSWVSRGATD